MAEKRSDNFMNFGPEWLQNLSQPQESNTSSNSSSKPRPAASTKCQLAEYRYGREEMLALFDGNAAAPDYLVKHEELYVANTQLPIALQNDVDEMRRYHQEPRVAGNVTPGRSARENVFRHDSRGRPPRNYYANTDPNFARSRSTSSNFRYFPERHGPAPPPGGDANTYRPISGGRARMSYWRRDGPNNEIEPWRSNEYRLRNTRTSWRDDEDKFNDLEHRTQARRTRKLAEEDPGDAPSLPEWAENDNVGGYSGSFDASGAYTESNTGDTKEMQKNEKHPPFESQFSDDLPPENPVEKVSKADEEADVNKDVTITKEEPEAKTVEDKVPDEVEDIIKGEEPSPPDFFFNASQVASQDTVSESSKPNEPVNKFLDPKPFNPTIVNNEENSQQNGCKVAENISSLLNWVLDETGPDNANKKLQPDFPLDPREMVQRNVLNLDRGDIVTDLERRLGNLNFANRRELSDIERRMKLEAMTRAAAPHDIKDPTFNANLHPQPGLDFSNMYSPDMEEYNAANNIKVPKFMPMANHLNPFPQVSPSTLNPNFMTLAYQRLPSEQPWAPDEGLLGEMALWDEQQMAKQLALQQQQQELLDRQLNLSQHLVVPPPIPQEQPAPVDTAHLAFPNFISPSSITSLWDELIQNEFQNTTRTQPSYGDMYNFYLQNNNLQNRVNAEPLLVEDVYRNSLNFQAQNQLLSVLDGGLQSNMNARNDLLLLLQRQQEQQLQQQQQQQQQQQVFVPPQPDITNLLTQQFPVETPALNFLNMPPPPLPQPIPMPERRAPQMIPATNNVSASSNPSTSSTTTVTTSEPIAPQVAPVVEEHVKQDVSNFEVVKKKDKKVKKKTEPDSDKTENGKKKSKIVAPATTKATPVLNQQQIQQQLLQQQRQQQLLQQRQMQPQERQQLNQQLQQQLQLQLRQELTASTGAKPKSSRPAPWLNQPQKDSASNMQPQMSLTQIQRLEKEQQRKAQSLHKAQVLSEQQQALQKEKESVPWMNFVSPLEEPKLSLLDIQYEEQRKQTMQQPFNSPPAPVSSNYSNDGIDSKLMKIGGIWGPPEASNSVWNFSNAQAPPSHTITASQKQHQHHQQQQQHHHHQQQQQKQQPVVEEPKKTAAQTEDDTDELNTWAKGFLKTYEHKLDVEAFLSFIRNIESPYEVKEYINFYLGETKETMDYCEDYIEKRLEINRRKNFVAPADDLSAPAAAINPAMNTDNQESKGKHKKTKKNKMSKIDSRILGFNVTAAADRFNIGDIESL